MNLNQSYPPAARGKIIVWGLLSSLPFGGMVWQVLHHVVGFRRLGFDVWYVEDSDRYSYDPITWCPTNSNVRLIAAIMEQAGLKDRWVLREPTTEVCHGGRDFKGLLSLYEECGAVFNLCNGQELLPRHDVIKCLVCLETDPGVPQISVAKGDPYWVNFLSKYDYIFTYAQNIGRQDCLLPAEKFQWIPTRPPVIMDWWHSDSKISDKQRLTTIANWDTKDKGIEWQGKTYYWQKDFYRFAGLPSKSGLPLELAVERISEQVRHDFAKNGWIISSSARLIDHFKYQDFICRSLGEFTPAKDQYVRLKTGWFSDRSVCYLAAGLPVVTEETGFSDSIGGGGGLFGFSHEEDILVAIGAIKSDYEKHSRRAREIAEQFFKAEIVLGKVADQIGL